MNFEIFRGTIALEITKQRNEELIVVEQGEEIKIKYKNQKGDGFFKFNLFNLYRAFESGVPLPSIVQRLLNSFDEEQKLNTNEFDFNQVKGRILPQLKPITVFRQGELQKAGVVYDDRMSIVGIGYVIDSSETMIFITNKHLEKWGINQKELHQLALSNLKTLPSVTKVEEPLLHYTSAYIDSYDAVRALTLDFEALEREFNDKVLVGIPNRDSLIVIPSSGGHVPVIARQVAMFYHTKPYEISPYLFLYENGELVPVKVETV